MSKFDHVRRALKVEPEDEGALSGINVEASGIGRVLKTLETGKRAKAEVSPLGEENERRKPQDRALICSLEQEEAKAAGLPSPSAPSGAAASSSSAPAPATRTSTSTSSTPVPYNQAPISTNRAAAAFTSTSAAVTTRTENAKWDEEYLMYEEVKDRNEKGYARMVTNYGALNFEVSRVGSVRVAEEGSWRRSMLTGRGASP